MAQPPVPGRGAGAEPAPGAGLPGSAGGRRDRDSRLAGFARGGAGDTCPPRSALGGGSGGAVRPGVALRRGDR